MRLSHRQSRAGFTLPELLLIVAIVAVVLALLVPALFKAHEAANRVHCANNLRQLGQACISFEKSYQYFPTSIKDTGPQRSWMVQILPWIGRSDLARQYDYHKNWCDPANAAVVSQQIPLLYCPASPGGPRAASGVVRLKTNDASGDRVIVKHSFAEAACSDYAVIHQVKDIAYSNGFANAYGPGMLAEDLFPRVSDIADGLSNTLMINESAGRPDEWMGRQMTRTDVKPGDAVWASRDNDFSFRGFTLDEDSQRYVNKASGPCAVNCSNIEGIYSFHRGGSQAVFGDGAVRFISQGVSTQLFARLVTRAGGEEVNLADY
jgi:type II secretory pathway pseudopilin PulG